jgi:hypothetical protein
MKLTRTVISSVAIGLACAPALAGLGGDATSVEADRASLKGALHITSAASYAVHEINSSDGMQVHEYVSPAGKVFAVSWRGAGIPDLRQMLGSYYGEFAQAASQPHYNHHHLSVQTANVVVQSSGHARSFLGRAWVPALLPQNFASNDIN